MLEDRQSAAHDHGRDDSVADGKSALHADHAPIVRHRRKEIDRADEPKGERQQPNGEPDAEAGANQFAAPPHLQGEIDGGESADQATDQERRIDRSEKDAAPETDEDGGVKSVIAPQQNAEDQRRERIGRDQHAHFRFQKPERAAVAKHQQELGRRELDQNDSENEQDARVLRKCLGLIDPQLGHGDAEKEQRDDEIFGRLRLLPAENEKRQAGDEARQNHEP